MEIYVLDMAALTVEVDGADGRICGPAGDLITTFDIPQSCDGREAFLLGCDAALDYGKVQRVDNKGKLRNFPVGLYNPYTYEVAVKPLPNTRAFSDNRPLEMPADGVASCFTGDSVTTEGRNLPRLQPDRNRFARAQQAHSS